MHIAAVKSFSVGQERSFFFIVVESDAGLRGVGEGGVTWREQATQGFVSELTPLW